MLRVRAVSQGRQIVSVNGSRAGGDTQGITVSSANVSHELHMQ